MGVGLGSPLAACSVYGDLTCSVHTVNNFSSASNYQTHVCLCIWGPYVRLASVPNMLSSWNKVIIISSSSIIIIPGHSLMLSSHLFFCLSLLLAPFTAPCRIVFAMPEDLEMCPYHLSFRFYTIDRRSSCTPIAFWILLRTSSFVTWSL